MIMSANWVCKYEYAHGDRRPAGRAVRKSWWYASCTGSDTDTENIIGAR